MTPGMPQVVGLECAECSSKIQRPALSVTINDRRVCLRRRCIERAIARVRKFVDSLEGFARGGS